MYFITLLFSKKKRFGNQCLVVLISIVAAVSIASLLKLFFARIEPKLFLSNGQYGFTFFAYQHPYLSFPSGHAATSGALFGAWSCFFPRWTWFLSFIAFALAFTRIILNAHFLSDIIAGTLVGLFVSQWTFLLMKDSDYRV